MSGGIRFRCRVVDRSEGLLLDLRAEGRARQMNGLLSERRASLA